MPDWQLACAPAGSPEGRRYLGAMAAAANHARANRQLLAEAAGRVLSETAGRHCTWSMTWPTTSPRWKPTRSAECRSGCACTGRERPGRSRPAIGDIPADLREARQPVLIPGSTGTSSYVLAGVPGGGAFASACHGAGRRMSRHQAARSITGPELRRLERQGIAVRGASARGLAEETPQAYKDITQVVQAAEGAGLCRKVARLVPLGVIKG